MKTPPIILASSSPRRAELLRQLGLPFRVVPPKVVETAPAHLSPREICQMNAYRKARAVAGRAPRAIVVAADTLVCLGLTMLGKPRSLAEARRTLRKLAGKTHTVITGVSMIHRERRWEQTFAAVSHVTFHPLTAPQIETYLRLIDPFDKAGAYAIQDHGHLIIESVSGSFSNVVGLPIEQIRARLTAL